MKFNCEYTSNPINIKQPYFDTLQVFISKSDPDLISFKETVFSNECRAAIESKGYQFIQNTEDNFDSELFFSPIAFKTSSFLLLGSAFFLYKEENLIEGKNIVSWFRLKSKLTGHIFYVFSLQLQDTLTKKQCKAIGYDLLKRIDLISSGAPVILIGDFFNKHLYLKEILTDNWKGIYPLNKVNSTEENSDFLINDFLKVKSSFLDYTSDSLVNNVVLKFNINTQRIRKNKTGESIPE